ncbi:MAG: class II aldolase/adducin family protein [Coriobacteriia bacterium]|nr:class II aldolase/adducin family protein [Coriobacteriia bacterium]
MTNVDFNQLADDIFDRISSVASSVGDAVEEASSGLGRLSDFYQVGRDLFISGAVTSHGGNLSVSDGRQIWISRTGSQLGHITTDDIIAVEWQPTTADAKASMELIVHRAMYHAYMERQTQQGTPFGTAAIVHAHSLKTTYQSLIKHSIIPADSEGAFILDGEVQVFAPAATIASAEVATIMADVVRSGGSIAVIRGHGPFAIADTLQNAYRLVSCLEYSAALLTLLEQAG